MSAELNHSERNRSLNSGMSLNIVPCLDTAITHVHKDKDHAVGFTAPPLASEFYDQKHHVNMQPWLHDVIPVAVPKLPQCTHSSNHFTLLPLTPNYCSHDQAAPWTSSCI